ncbi:putative integral membrane protein (TIGR02327 family) [Gracilibacillus halotolerans]|uniref:Putative integral membrane protein (TIGR02327 family) n=1 Tax=Gracilibacillus halotolerans TaxID=74386 RepID=A0A841RLI5_9BACI|nr:DUF1146 family protein [Gracilibacillus halotolerans]MBB6513631.1 putative integral membrane protein (TIGR02327 family) [Gracilibacillus halotolerans]
MHSLAQDGLVGIISHIFFIIVTWQVLQSINFDAIFRKNRLMEARILLILVTIAIGTTVSNFFLDFFFWSQQLRHFF